MSAPMDQSQTIDVTVAATQAPQSTTPTPTNFVRPNNTALPSEFYSSFNISPLHVQLNNNPNTTDNIDNNNTSNENDDATITTTTISLFDDLHVDHSLATNVDLMYEVLYQASKHVPSWSTIPFEVFCNIVEIKPLLGGFTNLLVSVELREEYLTNIELQATRPPTLQMIIDNIKDAIDKDDDVNVPVLTNPLLLRPLLLTNIQGHINASSNSNDVANISNLPNSPCLSPISCPNTLGLITPRLSFTANNTNNDNQTESFQSQSSQDQSLQSKDGIPAFIPVSSLSLPKDLSQFDIESDHYIYIKPSITKVAVRIYGTSEFTNRACELALAKAASDKQISEFVYCSWRHGRITSFLDGSSLGSVKWYDPILSSKCSYIQGQLHATNFLDCFNGTSLPVPPVANPQLQDMLKNWYNKSVNTKFYKAVAEYEEKNGKNSRISSVFDMFTSDKNALYVINRPACAIKNDTVRCENLILPLPVEIENILIPLLNAYQIDLPENCPLSDSYFTFPKRSQRTKPLDEFSCVKDGLLTIGDSENKPKQSIDGEISELKSVKLDDKSIDVSNYTVPMPPSRLLSQEESELIVEYLDLPRMKQEIKFLMSQCKLFPIVTSHNDFHSGNVLLLNSILQTKHNEPTAHGSDGHIVAGNNVKSLRNKDDDDDDNNNTDVAIASANTINNIEIQKYTQSNTYPYPVQLTGHPLPLPNQTSDWIKVIDFEYGGLNFRAYDVANSSNESWIVYDGSHPGFTLDIPAWVSTAYMGVYDPNVMILNKDNDNNNNDDNNKVEPYQCFDHCFIPSVYDPECLNDIIKVWKQGEDKQIGKDIQHILLGKFANKPYKATPVPFDKASADKSIPKFRPREVMWAEGCLTGFYHATKQHHYKTCPDPQNTPIYPFQTTSPPSPHFDPTYTLPATLEEWLHDQVPKLLYETMILQLSTMLAWSLWGITFTNGQMVEGFGYLEHALARMVAYVAKKEVLIKMGLLDMNPYDNNKK